jgi:hypothetical protein
VRRFCNIYFSYLKTALWPMGLATLLFFFYAGIRTSGPVTSISWYAASLAVLVFSLTITLTIAYTRFTVHDTNRRFAGLISAPRLQRKENPKSLSIIVPCFNESGAIPYLTGELNELVDRLRSTYDSVEVIFVDDASLDNTVAQLQRDVSRIENRVPIKILRHESSKGFEEAVRTGFAVATGDLAISVNAATLAFPKQLRSYPLERKLSLSLRLVGWGFGRAVRLVLLFPTFFQNPSLGTHNKSMP